MNKVILMGRLTRDPEIRYSQDENNMAIARYTLACDRKFKKDEADFISCVAFGKSAEFAEKYLKKGTKIAVTGRIQTGSYEKDGQKIYTTDVVIEEQEFAESKNSSGGGEDIQYQSQPKPAPSDGFMSIPDGIEDQLPFE